MVFSRKILVERFLAEGRHREIVDSETAYVVLARPAFEDDLGRMREEGAEMREAVMVTVCVGGNGRIKTAI